MKKIISFIMSVIMSLSLVGLVGCGEKVPNTDQTLEVYLMDLGYGSDWLQPMLDAFAQEDWVKEEYPELIIAKQINDTAGYGRTQLESDTTIDLLMTTGMDDTKLLYDITEDVYNKIVPGETVLYKNKIRKSFAESMATVKSYGDAPKYYAAPWADGMMSILYNENILQAAGISVPNTTDEFLAACQKLKTTQFPGKKDGFYPIAQGYDDSYWDSLFPVLWAQYDGVDGVDNFYNGIVGDELTKDIFSYYVGRKYAVEFMEQALDSTKGYLNPKSLDTNNFKTTQYNLLRGYSAFNANGDWFPSEMKATIAEMHRNNYEVSTIKIMRVPIISKIVDKTPSIKTVATNMSKTNDEMLSLIVSEIDAGATTSSYSGITQTDFDYIRKARGVVSSIGAYHCATIPNYAVGKKVACDFLRFMATEKAMKIYIENTCGATLPFEIDYATIKQNDWYDSIDVLHKERIQYFYSDNLTLQVLPTTNKYPLVKFGGVMAFAEVDYYNKLSVPNRKHTAQKYFEDCLKLWSDTKWDKALRDAGYKE